MASTNQALRHLLGFLAVGRNLSSCRHWDSGNLCKSEDSYPSFEPTPLHYTTHCGWGKSHMNLTSLTGGAQTSSTNGRRICLNHSLNGTSSATLITCLVEWVQLSLLGSKEKMSWYSTQETGQNPPALVAKIPIHSNLASWTVSPVCFIVSFSIWMPWASSNASIILGYICGSDTQLATTALVTGIFFFTVWGYAILFLTTMVTFLLPLA